MNRTWKNKQRKTWTTVLHRIRTKQRCIKLLWFLRILSDKFGTNLCCVVLCFQIQTLNIRVLETDNGIINGPTKERGMNDYDSKRPLTSLPLVFLEGQAMLLLNQTLYLTTVRSCSLDFENSFATHFYIFDTRAIGKRMEVLRICLVPKFIYKKCFFFSSLPTDVRSHNSLLLELSVIAGILFGFLFWYHL